MKISSFQIYKVFKVLIVDRLTIVKLFLKILEPSHQITFCDTKTFSKVTKILVQAKFLDQLNNVKGTSLGRVTTRDIRRFIWSKIEHGLSNYSEKPSSDFW